MKCDNCGSLINNQTGICPVCSKSFQNVIITQSLNNYQNTQMQTQVPVQQQVIPPSQVQVQNTVLPVQNQMVTGQVPVRQQAIPPSQVQAQNTMLLVQNQMVKGQVPVQQQVIPQVQPQVQNTMLPVQNQMVTGQVPVQQQVIPQVQPQVIRQAQPQAQNTVLPVQNQMVTGQVPVQSQVVEQPVKKKKLNKVKLSIFLVFIVAFVSCGLYYVFVIDKPRQVFITSIETLKTELKSSFKIKRKPYQISYDIKTDLNENDEVYGKLFKNMNELTVNINLLNNTEENYLFFELITTYQYRNHMNVIGVLDRNLLYLNSPATFKEYYAFDTHNNMFAGINRISDAEALLIMDRLLSSFEEVLKSDYFTKEEKKITLEGKELKLNSNNFIINESNIKEIVPKVMKVLKNDVEFINACAKYKNIDGIDFKGELNKIEESILLGEYKIPEMTLSIYLNDNDEIKGMAIKKGNKAYNAFFEENKIKIYENYDKKIVEITKEEEKYTINFNGGNIYIEYKIIENPMFSKPSVEGKNILYETLTDKEKKELEQLFYQDKVMEKFMLDFERFFKSIEISIYDILEPSKMKFKKEIEEIIDIARNKHIYSKTLSGNNIYTNEVLIPGNKLDIDKINSTYYVKINEEGMVKRVVYIDGLYCYDSSKLTNITNISKNDISVKHFMIRTKKDSYEGCLSNYSPFN